MTDDTKNTAPVSKGERQRRIDIETNFTAKGTVSQGGRDGGRLPRDIGTKDEMKRATERPSGSTRVTKSDEQEQS